ncbi:hypothetical protein J4218_00885 [Candidatus Pacearchaeota archaeon]|nr:hypothetical protein [Candidatus Pacearchaeota archaeon]
MKYECCECKRILNIGDMIVSSNQNQFFCLSEHAPLEEDSCARKYVERTKDFSMSYFFARLDK